MQIMSFYISLNQESDLISDPDKPTELPEFFPCEHFDQTIPWYQTCNNYPDCVDGSDENICGTKQKCKYRAYYAHSCSPEKFVYKNKFEKIIC